MSVMRLFGTIFVAVLLLGAFGLSSCSRVATEPPAENMTHAAATPADPNCQLSQNAAAFKQVVLDNNGRVEPIHIDGGLAILATAATPEGVAQIRAAAQSNVASNRALTASATASSEAAATSCAQIAAAVQSGTVQVSAADSEGGALLLYTTSDQHLAEMIQTGSCCDYCICPSTVTRCAGCC